MAAIEAVTFDFWNTLVRDDSLANRSRRVAGWLGVLEGEGFSVDGERVAEAFQANWDIFQSHWHQNRRYRAEDTVAYVLGRLGLDPPPAVRDALVAIITEPAVGHEPALNPNVASCLATLKQAGVRIGIICDVGLTPSPTLRHYLDGHGVLQYFDHWSFSDEVGVFKPDPVIFRHALAGLGVNDPAGAAHIGDLRRTDVAGANAMGITSVRYLGIFDDPGQPGDGPELQADHDLADHADLPALLGLA